MRNLKGHTMKHSIAMIIVAAAAALSLNACDRRDTAAAEKRVDAAVDSAGQRAEAAVDLLADKVADAAITASVNAALARDPALSALQINVDTLNGTVSLKGNAPDEAARIRAAELASAVKGVTNVNNQLEVRG